MIRLALDNKNVGVRREAVENIKFAEEAERADLIRSALGDEDWGIRWRAVKNIQFAPEDVRVDLIRLALEDEDEDEGVRLTAVENIKFAEEAERADLIRSALEDEDILVKLNAIQDIEFVLEDEERVELELMFVELIKLALKDENKRIRLIAAENIKFAPEDARADLIRSAFKGGDADVKLIAVKNIQFAPEDVRVDLIRLALEDEDTDVKLTAVENIKFAPEDVRADLIRLALENEDEGTDLYYKIVGNMRYLPKDELMELQEEKRDGLGVLAGKTRLYNNAEKKFFRKDFSKTGSGTTLLDIVPGDSENTLRERVIIRHIGIKHYFAWNSLYEAVDFWKEQGFDYVPIEPIVKAKLKDKITADVFCRVLNGPSYHEWSLGSNFLYYEEIEAIIDRIKEALKEFGVEHGHEHVANFVLVFDRDENGDPILDKIPKVYLIDFDMARFA